MESNRRLALAYAPWLVIIIGGTLCFVRIYQIQHSIQDQQTLNAQQIKTNVRLTLDGTATLNKALLKQCLEESNVDDKLAILGSDLLSSSVLDIKSKNALLSFSKEVKEDQVKLNCASLASKKI
jgi:hypothetical protein